MRKSGGLGGLVFFDALEEALGVDDVAAVCTRADEGIALVDFYGESDAVALHRLDLAMGCDFTAERGGCQVADIHMHADGGVAFGQQVIEQLAGVDLHEGNHGRGGEDAELTAADMRGGVLFFNGEGFLARCTGGEVLGRVHGVASGVVVVVVQSTTNILVDFVDFTGKSVVCCVVVRG